MRTRLTSVDDVKNVAEMDLLFFAQLVNPHRVYGALHEELFRWLAQEQEDDTNQLVLLPRGHQKSHCIAVWCAWWITKHPETTILYLSATSRLAEKQLYAIKAIMTSDIYTRYWPDMIHPDEGKREKWTTTEVSVDHPKRKEEGIRDTTITAAGLTGTTTGLHCDVLVSDDIVVPENAYTEEGRYKVASVMGQMASIKNPGAMTKACGTRYHPADIYADWVDTVVPILNDDAEILGERKLWEIMEKVVEIDGLFVWPKTYRSDGKFFGFDQKVLTVKKAEYGRDVAQFYAQYYNNPNDPESNRIDYSRFQYYNRKDLSYNGYRWEIKDKVLNVYASIDFAYTVNKASDYTAIVVIGISSDSDIYILDIDRFRTDKIGIFFEHISKLHAKWHIRKLRAEVTAAQSLLAADLKVRLKKEGLSLPIDEYRPKGKKEERIAAVLEPRYDAQRIWHYKGGYTDVLEEEVVLSRPRHDDIKDALAAAIELALPPKSLANSRPSTIHFKTHKRFGGVLR